MKINKPRKKQQFKTSKFSKSEIEDIKRKGIVLTVGGRKKRVKFAERLPVLINLKKPKINVLNESDSSRSIEFSIPYNGVKCYVEYLRSESILEWVAISEVDNTVKNQIYKISHDLPAGKEIKYRVSFEKDNQIQYSDFVFSGDKTYDYFGTNVNVIFDKKENKINITLYRLGGVFSNGSYFIYRKDNQENRVCIASGKSTGEIITLTDLNVVNNEYYIYDFDILDVFGNIIESMEYEVFYNVSSDLETKDITKSDKENEYFVNKTVEDKFEIEYIDFIGVESRALPYYEVDEKIIFSTIDTSLSTGRIKDAVINISGIKGDQVVSTAALKISDKISTSIHNMSIQVNDQNAAVISWDYKGFADRFIVTKENSNGKDLVGEVCHRKSGYGYLYIVDNNRAIERITTTYIINAIDNVGRVISKQRIGL